MTTTPDPREQAGRRLYGLLPRMLQDLERIHVDGTPFDALPPAERNAFMRVAMSVAVAGGAPLRIGGLRPDKVIVDDPLIEAIGMRVTKLDADGVPVSTLAYLPDATVTVTEPTFLADDTVTFTEQTPPKSERQVAWYVSAGLMKPPVGSASVGIVTEGEWPRLCTCAHWSDGHVDKTGKCKRMDSYGQPCECPSLELETDDEDGDDD